MATTNSYEPILTVGVTGTVYSGWSEGLADYRAKGGYDGLKRAVEIGPDKVLELVKAANIRGRGGAVSRPASSGASSRATASGRITSASTPTKASPGRSATARCSNSARIY